ncbi:secreted RxLR effector protein 161-like [Andrographis paniculata]|uniref:secreted RxLR effector protein 161-like n=1 Tax=Andrographis paniculata TaxID=175694 RepID=UPI0021E8DC24|nr:secreted RxLR effector protein 161-like [Andrographis paniculata]
MDGAPFDDSTLYCQLVGNLIYLTVTQPTIAYVVHIVSQFMSAPRTTHYSAVLRVLWYVKDTLLYGLHYSARSSLVLTGYSDADWAGDPTDHRSTTGFCFFLGDSLISWRSKNETPSTTTIHCDSQSTMKISTNNVFHEHTKHIEIVCHLVCHHVANGNVSSSSTSYADQTADGFTKPRLSDRFQSFLSKLKLVSTLPR